MRKFLSHLQPKSWQKAADAPTPHRELIEIESELKRRKREPDTQAQTSCSWDELSYTKLDHSQRQIRLLKLVAPYVWEQTSNHRYIDCTLTIVSLDSETIEYDALSYVWGDADIDKSHPIRINGSWHLITENLWIALRTIHQAVEGRYLWVDALCINQEDLEERSQQVSMMLDIYRQAGFVHILLSVVEDLSSDVQYLSGKHPFDMLRSLNDGTSIPNVYEMDEDVVGDLINFILRPWWKRLWVVQECIAAQRALAYIGNRIMNFAEIKDIIERILSSSYAHDGARKTQTRHLLTSLTVESIVFDKVQDFDLPSQQVLSRIMTTNMKQSTDPRDRIYAQLGYLPASIDIRPDYTLTVGELYRSTTLRLMQWDNSLFPLYIVDYNRRKSYPSWVPDYDHTFVYHQNDTNACPGLPAFFEERGKDELRVHALIVDTVQGYALEPQQQLEGDDEHFEATRFAVLECMNTARSVIMTPTGSDPVLRNCVWRTLCRGDVDRLNPDLSTEKFNTLDFDASMLEAWLAGPLSSEQKLVGMLHNINRISATVNAEAFFVTAEKRFGTTYGFGEVGDVVALLAGSRVPMILRRLDREEESFYKVVGACYCDGIMNGEAISDIVNTNETGTALDYGFEGVILV